MLDLAATSRERAGLGAWAVRERATGRLAGTAGVDLTALDVWNLGYRFHPDLQGRGLASAVSRRAIDAAHDALPDAPVVARMIDTNPASIRVAERLGLDLAWHGTAVAADGTAASRRIYADRDLSADLLARLVALG